MIAAVLTTNLRLAQAPGNVLVAAGEAGLSRDSVVNVSQVVTVDKAFLTERAGRFDGRHHAGSGGRLEDGPVVMRQARWPRGSSKLVGTEGGSVIK